MRKPLKLLWNSIIDKNNEDRMFDLMCLLFLIIKNEIYPNEMQELKEYAKEIII